MFKQPSEDYVWRRTLAIIKIEKQMKSWTFLTKKLPKNLQINMEYNIEFKLKLKVEMKNQS